MSFSVIVISIIFVLFHVSFIDSFQSTPLRSWNPYVFRHKSNSRLSLSNNNPKILSSDEINEATIPLMQLASGHFIPQVLRCLVELGIPDVIGNKKMTIDEISTQITSSDRNDGSSIQKDALFRIMRVSAAVGVTKEELVVRTQPDNTSSDMIPQTDQVYAFSLTSMGALLQTSHTSGQPSLVSCVQHWTEPALWNSWLHLSDYVIGKGGLNDLLPFDRANGMSSDKYYGHDNMESLRIANDFVRFISDGEITAIVDGFDWMMLSGKTLVDVGGHNGKVIGAVAAKFPTIQCLCLDLPEVITSVADPPPGVTYVGGDVMNPSTIPKCDAIFMKHILDKSMWDEKESEAILKSCHAVLPRDGKVIIAEAVLPNVGQGQGSVQLLMDVQFLLVGRKGQRAECEWDNLATKTGFKIENIIQSSVSCYILVLTKSEV